MFSRIPFRKKRNRTKRFLVIVRDLGNDSRLFRQLHADVSEDERKEPIYVVLLRMDGKHVGTQGVD